MLNKLVLFSYLSFLSGKKTFLKRILVLAFCIIFVISFLAPDLVYAAAIPETVVLSVALTAWLFAEAGQQGHMIGKMMKEGLAWRTMLQTDQAVTSSSMDAYYSNYVDALHDLLDNGNISENDSGYVMTVNDVPVACQCNDLGFYAFFCTKELATLINRSSDKSIGTIQHIIDEYWNSKNISNQAGFESAASNYSYWVISIDSESNIRSDALLQSAWTTYGVNYSHVDETFIQTGNYALVSFANSSSQNLSAPSNFRSLDYDYVVMRCPDYHVTGSYATTDADQFVLYYHDPNGSDPVSKISFISIEVKGSPEV